MGIIGKLIDRVALDVAPGWGARRIATRRLLADSERRYAALQAHYEAADNDRFRGHKWFTSKLSPDSALEQDLDTLRERSEQLVRDDPYAAGVIDNSVVNIVGKGFKPQSRIKPLEGRITEEQAKRYRSQLENVFKRWAVKASADGRTFAACEKDYCRSWLVTGDAFATMVARPDVDKPIPLAIKLAQLSRIATPPELSQSSRVRLGIERDGDGRPVKYWVQVGNPGDYKDFDLSYKPVPADVMLHLFDRLAIGQSRGIPWLTPVMTILKDLKDYREAEIVAAQVAACFTVFVKTTQDAATLALRNSGGVQSGTNPRSNYEEIEPGRINYLNDNEEIQFADPKRPGQTYDPFVNSGLRAIAAGLNYPFELLAKNFSGVSYSGGRLVLIDARIAWGVRQDHMIQTFHCPVWNQLVDEAVLTGELDVDERDYARDPWPYREHVWRPNGWPWIDPKVDIAAARDAIEARLSTHSRELGAIGLDTEETFIELHDEQELARSLQLESFSRPGSPQAAPTVPGDQPSNGTPAAPANQPDPVGAYE